METEEAERTEIGKQEQHRNHLTAAIIMEFNTMVKSRRTSNARLTKNIRKSWTTAQPIDCRRDDADGNRLLRHDMASNTRASRRS